MSYEQEMEERNYFPQSEERNAYEEARQLLAEINAHNAGELDAAMRLGLYAVVLHTPHHCNYTDAVVGEAKIVHSTHLTRAAADAVADEVGDEYCLASVHPKAKT